MPCPRPFFALTQQGRLAICAWGVFLLALAGPGGPDAWAATAPAPVLPPAAAASAPGLPAKTFESAQALLQRGSPAAALELAESQPEQQAREPRWRFLRALALSALGRLEESAAVYTRLTQDFPDIAEPHNNLAVLRAAQGRLDDARDGLERALRADPALREAHENLGDVHLRLAIRHWETAAVTSPVSPTADPALMRKLKLARELAVPAR
jgi:tetratricopeptide (TPR) repeat protein